MEENIMRKFHRIVPFLAAGLSLSCAAATTHAAMVLLDGESPDTGTTATNKLGTSGVTFYNNAVVDSTAADAKFGSGSFNFSDDQSSNPTNKLELLGTSGETLSQFTLAADIRLDQINGIQRIFGGRENVSGTGRLFALQVSNGYATYTTQIGFYMNYQYIIPMGGYGALGYQIADAETDVYHNVAATFDGSTVTLYWDGTAIATGAATAPTLQSNLFVGSDAETNGISPYHGNMDNILVYNKALTADQVSYMYQHGADALLLPEPTSMGLLMGMGVMALSRRRRRVA
jgi:hypothetical protein